MKFSTIERNPETKQLEAVFSFNDRITITIPVTNNSLIDGLIPEGWLLNIASESWKINKLDRMGLLLACCQNTIGAVSVHPINESVDA